MIDSHQHFWTYDEAQYPWIPKGSPLERDWLPEDWREAAEDCGIHGCIAVQARQTVDESRWLLNLAREHAFIQGVFGWVDLQSEQVELQLVELSQSPKFVGVRHVVQDEPDDLFMLRPEFVRGISRLNSFQLAYDLLVFPRQLPAALELVRRFPEQRFILDHIAKPSIKSGSINGWKDQIEEMAGFQNVWCKVSGMVTEADHQQWKPIDFQPYLDTIFEAFRPERLMFGSDWPVCLLAGSYGQVFDLVQTYTRDFSAASRHCLFTQNVVEAYRLPV
jgi:L-fuconolactonase